MRYSTLLRAKLAVMSLFTPWLIIKDLRRANEKLVSTISDPLLTGMNIGNGTIDVGMTGPASELVAGMFLGMFNANPDARNYIQMTFSSPQGPIMVTAVRPGGMTPHDMIERERHLGNEWADMATNGIEWLKSLRDGLATPDEGLMEMTKNLQRIRKLQANPVKEFTSS
jgi:hypothetical protein